MILTAQMLAGLAVLIGAIGSVVDRKWQPLFQLALPGALIWLILGWATGWAIPD